MGIFSDGLPQCGYGTQDVRSWLISLLDRLDVRISRYANDPDGARAFINRSGRAIASQQAFERPHPHFLRWHLIAPPRCSRLMLAALSLNPRSSAAIGGDIGS